MPMLMPSVFSACSKACATMREVRITALQSASSISKISAECFFGMTSACPGFTGLMSRNASVSSSSYTICAGSSRAAILQKIQSAIVMYSVYNRALSTMHDLISTLLTKRGVTSESDIAAFLNPDYDLHTHDPFLLAGMDTATGRLLKAIGESERIAVYADC